MCSRFGKGFVGTTYHHARVREEKGRRERGGLPFGTAGWVVFLVVLLLRMYIAMV